MKGYLKNPQATAAAFRNGWYHSGDLGVWHADNYIEIKDRAKDIIISGGENISSLEVEECLYSHPQVVEAAVVARPDARWGETPCAFVTLKPDAGAVDPAAIIAWCRDASRALQGTEDGRVRPVAEDVHRQDPEVRAARARAGARRRVSAEPRAALGQSVVRAGIAPLLDASQRRDRALRADGRRCDPAEPAARRADRRWAVGGVEADGAAHQRAVERGRQPAARRGIRAAGGRHFGRRGGTAADCAAPWRRRLAGVHADDACAGRGVGRAA